METSTIFVNYIARIDLFCAKTLLTCFYVSVKTEINKI